MRKNCTFLGAATDLGQSKAGTELAPSWLRLKGTHSVLARKFYNISDLGDLTPVEKPTVKGHDHPAISHYNKRLGDTILDELNRERMVITLGGDHSVAIGTLSASLRHNPDTKVVWVDAHADLNTPETSPSGNLHGMPLAFFFDLLKEGPTKNLFHWVPRLKPENLVYLGLRDVDAGEERFIEELGITAFYAKDIAEQGIEKVLRKTVKQLCPQGNEDLHLSFDVDGLDPKYVPATGTPVPGGLDLIEGQKIINTMMRKSNVISFDLVEVNPLLGSDAQDLELTAESSKALLEALPTWDDKGATLDKLLFEL